MRPMSARQLWSSSTYMRSSLEARLSNSFSLIPMTGSFSSLAASTITLRKSSPSAVWISACDARVSARNAVVNDARDAQRSLTRSRSPSRKS